MGGMLTMLIQLLSRVEAGPDDLKDHAPGGGCPLSG